MPIDTYPMGILIVGGCVAASLLGLVAFRRWLHRHDLEGIKDVASYLFAVVGTLYAVILGLVVVDAMSKFYEARLTVEEESNALSDILLFATKLPPEGSARVRDLAEAYIREVVDVEWPRMAAHGASPEARKLAFALVQEILSFEPADEREQQLFASQVEAATDFWNCRRTRTILAVEAGLHGLEWIVLVVGGTITVVFTYFFKVDRLGLQMAMTAMLSAVIALNLYLILMFASPFSGDIQVRPQGFELSQYILEHTPRP